MGRGGVRVSKGPKNDAKRKQVHHAPGHETTTTTPRRFDAGESSLHRRALRLQKSLLPLIRSERSENTDTLSRPLNSEIAFRFSKSEKRDARAHRPCASASFNENKKQKKQSTQAGGPDERTISRDEWAARLRAARVAPAALNAIVMDFLVTEVREEKD